MKLLSITVPCYNSQDYMSHCIETLLTGGENVEIIIINDGSKDSTLDIANKYKEQYPSIVRVVDKENGGHGSGVMSGVEHAKGKYFKVVDSDDWVDADAFRSILNQLKIFEKENTDIDLLLSNFVYDKVGVEKKKIMNYKNILPENKIFTWDDVGHFIPGKYILMHSIIYRTELLRDCKLDLPKHTFYVDNIFAFQPLPYVKSIYYLNVNFYHYFIGRDDQSVNEEVMIRRIDQQLRVNKIMIDNYAQDKPLFSHSKKLCHYMYNYLEIITTVSSIMLLLSGTKENLEKKKALWEYLKTKDRPAYRKMRTRFLGFVMNLPGKVGVHLSVKCYELAQKSFGFN